MSDLGDVVRRRKGAEILLSLHEEPRHIREIQQLVGGSASTINRRVDEFIDQGLIEQKESEEWPFRRTLRLTETGREAAETIRALGLFEPPGEAPDIEDLGDGEKLLLGLMAGVGGTVQGSTRLVKLVFLLDKKAGTSNQFPYEFRPHHFGPFDPEVLEDATALKRLGLIEFSIKTYEPEIGGDEEDEDDPEMDLKVRRDYHMTESGQALGDSILESLPSDLQKGISELGPFNQVQLRDLVEYVYQEYPEESGEE